MGVTGRVVGTVAAGVTLVGVLIQPSFCFPSLSKLKQDFSRNSRRLQEVRTSLRNTKKRQRTAAYRLSAAQRRLDVTRHGLRDIQYQLVRTRSRLSATQARLVVIERRLRQRNDLLSARLVDTYKYGSVSYLNVLVGAADFWDLLSRGYAIRKVLSSDISLVQSISRDKSALEEHRNTLETQKRIRQNLEAKQRSLTHLAHEQTQGCRRILRDIERDRAKQEEMLAALEADSRSIAAMMRRLQQTPSGRKRLGHVWRGSFMKPVAGSVTSGFGMRVHPIFHTRRMHTGVDIAASSGTTIVAAAGGYVAYAGWRPAYGKTVVIDHGGDVISFYGHCSSFLTGAGRTVRQGEPIATVGSTGLSTGPHVHFEVQKNGVSVSPY